MVDSKRGALVGFALLGACSGGSGNGPADSTRDSPSGACTATSTGDLAGVTIVLSSERCTYRRGDAARFTWDLVTTSELPPLQVAAESGCGDCRRKGVDPATWVDWRIGGTSANGNAMQFCYCDVGCCPAAEEQTVSVAATSVAGIIDWTGRQWSGPSDTSNPMGDFFEPGNYVVTVGFYGGTTGQVVAELPIVVED